MPLSLSEDTAQLVGVVSVDEAEPLAQWLRDSTAPSVGLARCTALHTAALQALLAARPVVVAPPTDPFLVTWVLPLLVAADAPALDAQSAEADDAAELEPLLDGTEPETALEEVGLEGAGLEESVLDETETELAETEDEAADEPVEGEPIEGEPALDETEVELSLEEAEALWALAQAEEAEAEARALAGADLPDVELDESLVLPAGLAALGEPDEFDGLELDESLVIPAALAALAEPEAELI